MSTSEQSSHDSELESFKIYHDLKRDPDTYSPCTEISSTEKPDPSEIRELYDDNNAINDQVIQKRY